MFPFLLARSELFSDFYFIPPYHNKILRCISVEPSRKRGRSSMLASPRDRDTTGPAVKKKKTSCSPSQSQTGMHVLCHSHRNS